MAATLALVQMVIKKKPVAVKVCDESFAIFNIAINFHIVNFSFKNLISKLANTLFV